MYDLEPRGARLTSAGRFWEDEARRLLAGLGDAAARFSKAYQKDDRSLRIAAGASWRTIYFHQWLVGWSGDRFGHFCDIDVGNSTAVHRSVIAGTVELGLL